jgi:hypothetical protein
MMGLKILDLFRAAGVISESTFEVVKKFAMTWGCSGAISLLETNVFDESQLADILASTLKIDRIYNVSNIAVNLDVLQRIPYQLSLKFECLPLNFCDLKGKKREFLFADPTDENAQAEIRHLLGCELSLAVGERSDIVNAIKRLYPVEMQLPSIGVPDVRRSADGQ